LPHRRNSNSDWAKPFVISTEVEKSLTVFSSGFALRVPLMDTTSISIISPVDFKKPAAQSTRTSSSKKLEDVDPKFDLVVNCAGIGARELVYDADLEPHRGQVAIVPKIDNLQRAVVCDDAPLMYAIRAPTIAFSAARMTSAMILQRIQRQRPRSSMNAGRVLEIEKPRVVRERVGLRPFRKSGVRLEKEKLRDGRTGFTTTATAAPASPYPGAAPKTLSISPGNRLAPAIC